MAALGLAMLATRAAAVEYIAPDEWPELQRGIQVTQYARLAGIVDQFDRTENGLVVILYPGGASGQQWATGIRDWFVALGIPGRRIELRPGSGVPESIGLRVEQSAYTAE
ncbi:MAG TPA: hypothetical protein VK973_17620 [Arenicellales bacterium]|nr:hypothetical protein [Arenicellales bacterium]